MQTCAPQSDRVHPIWEASCGIQAIRDHSLDVQRCRVVSLDICFAFPPRTCYCGERTLKLALFLYDTALWWTEGTQGKNLLVDLEQTKFFGPSFNPLASFPVRFPQPVLLFLGVHHSLQLGDH